MKKFISLTLSAILLLSMALCVSAADPIWQTGGADIGFKCFSDSVFHQDDFYSHAAEENSDYYCENATDEATGIAYKHITPAGLDTRPQKQINLATAVGPAEEIFMVNGMLINEGDEFFLDYTKGLCVKAVVRTNFATTPSIKYNNYSTIVEAETAMAGTGEWEEVYIVFPEDTETVTNAEILFFIFGDINKEDYPEGAYADIAALAAFKTLSDAVSCNIAPELIAAPSAPAAAETTAPETEAPETEAPVETEAPETEAPETEPVVDEPETTAPVAAPAETTAPAPQTFDAVTVTALAAIMSAGTAVIIKKNGKR